MLEEFTCHQLSSDEITRNSFHKKITWPQRWRPWIYQLEMVTPRASWVPLAPLSRWTFSAPQLLLHLAPSTVRAWDDRGNPLTSAGATPTAEAVARRNKLL